MDNEKLICPNCGCPIEILLDNYGRTPFHLRCYDCEIDIGATSIKRCIEIFKKHHKGNTYIEYYENAIQLFIENGKIIKEEYIVD